jgi:hypothetical protein
MGGSAALNNVRCIQHYWEEQRKEARREMAAEAGAIVAPEQPGDSFSSYLKMLLAGQRSLVELLKAYIGC